jgi:hypothetical protein
MRLDVCALPIGNGIEPTRSGVGRGRPNLASQVLRDILGLWFPLVNWIGNLARNKVREKADQSGQLNAARLLSR